MNWTTNSPTNPGWYWYRENEKLSVAEIYKHAAYPRLRARLIHRDAMAESWIGEWWPQRLIVPDSES